MMVRLRRDDGYRERLTRFRARFRHFRKPLRDKAGPILLGADEARPLVTEHVHWAKRKLAGARESGQPDPA